MESKRRVLKIIVPALLIFAVLMAGIFLYINTFIAANRSTSPDGRYRATYNRLEKRIMVREVATNVEYYEGECEDPEFLWSPDSQRLARNISSPGGWRRTDIQDFERGVVHSMPYKSTIEEAYGETSGHSGYYSAGECVEITKWLDSDNVLVEFSWPSDMEGETISGWFIYDFKTWTIKELTISSL